MINSMKYALLLTVLLTVALTSVTMAQADQLSLRLSRDWGYGGLNGDIQGLFSMRVTGPADLARVEYFIDDVKIGEVTALPYNLQFTTDSYPLGIHDLYAIGYSISEQEFRSNVISANFVPEQSAMKIILPVLGVVLAAILLSTLPTLLAKGGKRVNIPPGTERKYGAGGGGICPKCHRPFSLPLFGVNLGLLKLAACPFCGRRGLVRVESIFKLREAEKAELKWTEREYFSEIQDDEKLKKDIDESKYQGL
jgi:hypothetical protein